jgi:PLD-like domain
VSIVLKLSVEFERVKRQAVAAYISVGMITRPKLEYFLRGIAPQAEISILIGIQMPTPPEILERLLEETTSGRIRSRIYVGNYFHPKVYCFKMNEGWTAFVGSGNFTNGGWHENEELFVKITDPGICQNLRDQHLAWMAAARPIDPPLIEKYKNAFARSTPRRNEERKSLRQLIDDVTNTFNIDNVDFTGQFFTREDHMTFAAGKTQLDTIEVLAERNAVRNKLIRLNEQLERVMPSAWDIHPHYIAEHIAAHIQTNFHHEENVRALWVAYGRDWNALKAYGEEATPLNYMRMQVIIGFDYIGVWLMPGKSGGGAIDRENLRERMANQAYREQFFSALRALGEDYWIEIAATERGILSFKDADELYEFVRLDNWRYYYFTIGRNYLPGYEGMKTDRILGTVLRDFKQMLPLYNLIKHRY